MNIAGYQTSLNAEACDIFLAGCHAPHCEDCHNPDLWDFDCGKPWQEAAGEIYNTAKNAFPLVKRFRVMGGEPMDQDMQQLERLLTFLKGSSMELWLFTSRELGDIDENIKHMCDVIKTGKYIRGGKKIKVLGVTLASDNQSIYVKQEDGTWMRAHRETV